MMILNEVFFYPSYISDAYVKGELLQLLQNNTLDKYFIVASMIVNCKPLL